MYVYILIILLNRKVNYSQTIHLQLHAPGPSLQLSWGKNCLARGSLLAWWKQWSLISKAGPLTLWKLLECLYSSATFNNNILDKLTFSVWYNRFEFWSLIQPQLQKAWSASHITLILILWLCFRGLINDGLYAEAFSRSRWSSSTWGPRKIKQVTASNFFFFFSC